MDQQLKLAEEEAQEYQAYLHKLDQETEDDNQVGTKNFGYIDSGYCDNQPQWQFFFPKKGPSYTENHRVLWPPVIVTLLPIPGSVTEVLCTK